jgi:hypothetical protein
MRSDHIEGVVESVESHSETPLLHRDCNGWPDEPCRQVYVSLQFLNGVPQAPPFLMQFLDHRIVAEGEGFPRLASDALDDARSQGIGFCSSFKDFER